MTSLTKNKYLSKGFSVIEVILAAAIFMLFSTASVVVILHGFNTNRLGAEETIANQFAAEGIEAVKSIKNQAYTNLVNSAGTGVIKVAGLEVWAFSGANNTLIHNSTDNYTRVIKVESVNRDGSGNIVATGGTNDPDTKKITSTVNWNFNSARPESVVLSSYLSDWRKPIIIGGPTMMVYSKTTNIPYYRTWDGSNWSAEAATQTAFYGNINYMIVKSSRTRNEAILGVLDVNGVIYVQVWNGSSWSAPTYIATVGTTSAGYRGFDIEYEENGDRAMVVYLPSSTSVDPAYTYWDGNTWSTPITITAPPTTGIVRWIELAQNPVSTSNEIAMIMLDADSDVYGMAWNGSSWSNMGVSAVWDATASIATKKAIDVAYEQTSGRAMFIWGDAISTDQYYRIWNGSTLTANTLLDIPSAGGVVHWMKLVSRTNSNELMYGEVDAGADLNTRKWSGSSWDTVTQHPEHDASTENILSMNFDLIWETHSANPGKAWLMWGAGAKVSKKQWSGTAWGAGSVLTGSDDTSFVRLNADPSSGAIFAGIYESATSATDDIWESHLTSGGSTWSAKNTIWGGPVSAEPVYFRVDIATP